MNNLALALLATAFSISSHADPLYKSVDNEGRVTITNMKSSPGNVKQIILPAYQQSPPVVAPATPVAPRPPAASVALPRATAAPVAPIPKIATGVFIPESDTFRPASRVLSLYVTSAAQGFANLIWGAATQWGSACGVQFEYVNAEAPAVAPPGRTVVVVDYGPGSTPGASATTFRKLSGDGKAMRYARVIITDTRGESDLYFAVLHELGHTLGLPHASDPAAVMHLNDGNRRYYVSARARASLTATDIDGCVQMMAGVD